MRLFRASPAAPNHTEIPSALTSFVDEVYGTLSRLSAYAAALALFGVLGHYLWQQLPDATAMQPAAASWSVASRSAPAFAMSQIDSRDKTMTYNTSRHPEGGRKDVFQWADADGKPAAELEIYRPGGEAIGPAVTEIAGRLDPSGVRELEAAGIIDSKFGRVTLLRPARQEGSPVCLGFLRQLEQPNVRISGWTCQNTQDTKGASLPAQRAAISCMLNRLTLLTAGNDPRVAELFAHADLRRTDCSASSSPALSADWVMGSENPRLRGPL
jgi:hypothetical protein